MGSLSITLYQGPSPGHSIFKPDEQVFPQIIIASVLVVSVVGLALYHQLARHISGYLLGETVAAAASRSTEPSRTLS